MTHGIIHGFQVQARCAVEQRQQLILDAAGRDMSNEAMGPWSLARWSRVFFVVPHDWRYLQQESSKLVWPWHTEDSDIS